MRKCAKSIDEVKAYVNELTGRPLKISVNKGRKKIVKYSGSILAYIYSGNALYAQNPAALQKVREKLCDQAVRDLLDHNAYWDTYRGTISEVSDKVNDMYLKANAQEAGTKSYGRMVDLLLAWNRDADKVF